MSPAWMRRATVAAVLVVAATAAAVSYSHMLSVAREAGEEWRAHLIPLSVDGLLVAASMTMLVRRRMGLPAGWLAWVALLGGIAASLLANVAAAEPATVPRLVAAWPAVAFAVSFELLLQQGRTVGRNSSIAEPLAHLVDRVGEVGADPGEVDELVARAVALAAEARAAGRPVGRRTVARELGVSEHRARALLAVVSPNGGAADVLG